MLSPRYIHFGKSLSVGPYSFPAASTTPDTIIPYTATQASLGRYRPVSFRNLPAAVVGGESGQDDTASSISSRNVVLLWTVVPPRTIRMPGDEALIWDTVFASSNVTPPTMKSTMSCGLSRVDPPPSTNGYCCSRRRPLIRFCSVSSNRGECCVYTFSTPFRPLKRSRAPENIPADSNISDMPPAP
jgi:hypothetical protein